MEESVHYRCKACLGPAKLYELGENAVCGSCSHKTPRRTSELLRHLVTALGNQVAGLMIISLVNVAIGGAGLNKTSNGLGENVLINGKMVSSAILTVDPSKVFSQEVIEGNGVKKARELIEPEMKRLSRILGVQVSFAVVASAMAYLYDIDTAKMAPALVQQASEKLFVLEPDGSGRMNAIHINNGIDEVAIIMGKAQKKPLAVTQAMHVMEIIDIEELPLIVAFRSGDPGRSRLIFYYK